MKKCIIVILIFAVLNALFSGCASYRYIDLAEYEDQIIKQIVTIENDTLNFNYKENYIYEIKNDSIKFTTNLNEEKFVVKENILSLKITEFKIGETGTYILIGLGSILAAFIGMAIAFSDFSVGG